MAERIIAYKLTAGADATAKAEFDRFAQMGIAANRAIESSAAEAAKQTAAHWRAAASGVQQAMNGSAPGAAATQRMSEANKTAKQAADAQIREAMRVESEIRRINERVNMSRRGQDTSDIEKAVALEEKARETAAKKQEQAIARLERQQEAAAGKLRAAAGQMRESYERATEGVLKLGRGITALGLVGEEDTKKILEALLKVQGVIDLTRGGIDIYRSLSGAAEAYRNRVLAVAAAEKVAAAARAVTGVGGLAGSAGGVAGAAGNLSGLGTAAGGASLAVGGLAATATAAAAAIAGVAAAAAMAFNVGGSRDKVAGMMQKTGAFDDPRGWGSFLALGPTGGVWSSGESSRIRQGAMESVQRTEQMEDTRTRAEQERDRLAGHRRLEFESQAQQTSMAGRRRMEDLRLTAAGTDTTGMDAARARQAELAERRAAANAQRQSGNEQLATANARAAALAAQQARAGFDVSQSVNPEEIAEANAARLAALQEVKAAEMEILATTREAHKTAVEAERQRIEQVRERQRLEQSIADREAARAAGALQSAEARREEEFAQFGRLSGAEQTKVREAARRMQAGQELSDEQRSSLERFETFREQLRAQDIQRGRRTAGAADAFGAVGPELFGDSRRRAEEAEQQAAQAQTIKSSIDAKLTTQLDVNITRDTAADDLLLERVKEIVKQIRETEDRIVKEAVNQQTQNVNRRQAATNANLRNG